jgi:hypothetical protein
MLLSAFNVKAQISNDDSLAQSTIHLIYYPINTTIEIVDRGQLYYSSGQKMIELEFDEFSEIKKYVVYFLSGDTAKISEITYKERFKIEGDTLNFGYRFGNEVRLYYPSKKIKSIQYFSENQNLKFGYDDQGNEVYNGIMCNSDTISGVYYGEFKEGKVYFNYYQNGSIKFIITAFGFQKNFLDVYNAKKRKLKFVPRKLRIKLNEALLYWYYI